MFRPKCTDDTKERLKRWREDGTWDDAINKVIDLAIMREKRPRTNEDGKGTMTQEYVELVERTGAFKCSVEHDEGGDATGWQTGTST